MRKHAAMHSCLSVARAALAVLTLALALPAVAAPSKREIQAREAFAAGRYGEALDLFAKLYADTLHPTYLRNIGRCHQNLGDPDKAIASFRDYLRKAKKVTPAEKQEVEGFIAEMEELKKRKAAAATPDPRPGPPPPDPVVAAAADPPPPPRAEVPSVVLTAPPPAEDAAPPVYKRWWFWAAVGGAVAAGTVAAIVLTRSGSDPCPSGVDCK